VSIIASRKRAPVWPQPSRSGSTSVKVRTPSARLSAVIRPCGSKMRMRRSVSVASRASSISRCLGALVFSASPISRASRSDCATR
jgi:hypothetical protein